ncbi:MAG: YjgP/YjgQ family permease [Rhodothermales bacterium]|nr:YjgP/YjgQ family permease [Rhodothermales bacterium]
MKSFRLTHFHRMILRMLPGPMLGWLGVLMFLLLMQFLIKYLPDLVGKGLPFFAIVELVMYSLAYMVVLAVPMAVLIASLMTFSRLAESRAYVVMKGAGASFPQIVWPVLIVGVIVTAFMFRFNNVLLPESNFRARNLWTDIRQKKPGFELQPGIFYQGVSRYSILVKSIDQDTGIVEDVTIYDYSEGSRKRVDIKASSGHIETGPGGSTINIVLEDGELHRRSDNYEGSGVDRYERLTFARHRLSLDISDFIFERSNPTQGRRSDRTMRTTEMVHLVDSLRQNATRKSEELYDMVSDLALYRTENRTDRSSVETEFRADSSDSSRVPAVTLYPHILADAGPAMVEASLFRAAQNGRAIKSKAENSGRIVRSQLERADRFSVEIQKKYSIALACFVFMLIGAPLGLAIRRGGLGTAAVLAVGIFLFHWVALVQGEKLADRGLLEPWVGMWMANIVTLLIALYFTIRVSTDASATGPVLRNFISRVSGRSS